VQDVWIEPQAHNKFYASTVQELTLTFPVTLRSLPLDKLINFYPNLNTVHLTWHHFQSTDIPKLPWSNSKLTTIKGLNLAHYADTYLNRLSGLSALSMQLNDRIISPLSPLSKVPNLELIGPASHSLPAYLMGKTCQTRRLTLEFPQIKTISEEMLKTCNDLQSLKLNFKNATALPSYFLHVGKPIKSFSLLAPSWQPDHSLSSMICGPGEIPCFAFRVTVHVLRPKSLDIGSRLYLTNLTIIGQNPREGALIPTNSNQRIIEVSLINTNIILHRTSDNPNPDHYEFLSYQP
jgi:Leucine-rich repeat (LRR) protein